MTQRKPNAWQLIKSVMGAMVGIQSEKQRHEDFSTSSPLPFILVGVLFTLLFVVILWTIVSWVLA